MPPSHSDPCPKRFHTASCLPWPFSREKERQVQGETHQAPFFVKWPGVRPTKLNIFLGFPSSWTLTVVFPC